MALNAFRTNRAERSGGQYSSTPAPRRERQVSGKVSKRPDARLQDRRSALSDAVTHALAARRYSDALNHILNLIGLDPAEPRWHQKYGEVLRTLGRNREAAAAYRRVARRYEALALPGRAGAALRVADALDGRDSSERIARLSSDHLQTQPLQRPQEMVTTRPPRE